jgi:hypothetical protein
MFSFLGTKVQHGKWGVILEGPSGPEYEKFGKKYVKCDY